MSMEEDFALREPCLVTVLNKESDDQQIWVCKTKHIPGYSSWDHVMSTPVIKKFFNLDNRNGELFQNACIQIPKTDGHENIYLLQLQNSNSSLTPKKCRLKTLRLETSFKTFTLHEDIPVKEFDGISFDSIHTGVVDVKEPASIFVALFSHEYQKNVLLNMIPEINPKHGKNYSYEWRTVQLPDEFNKGVSNKLTWDGFYLSGQCSMSDNYFCDLKSCVKSKDNNYAISGYQLFFPSTGKSIPLTISCEKFNPEKDSAIIELSLSSSDKIPELRIGIEYEFRCSKAFEFILSKDGDSKERPPSSKEGEIFKSKMKFFNEASFLEFGMIQVIPRTTHPDRHGCMDPKNIHVCRTKNGAEFMIQDQNSVSFDSWNTNGKFIRRNEMHDSDGQSGLLTIKTVHQMIYSEGSVYINLSSSSGENDQNTGYVRHSLFQINLNETTPIISKIASLTTPKGTVVYMANHTRTSPFFLTPKRQPAKFCLSAIFMDGRYYTCTCNQGFENTQDNISEMKAADVFSGNKGSNMEAFQTHLHTENVMENQRPAINHAIFFGYKRS